MNAALLTPTRTGTWRTLEKAKRMLAAPDPTTRPARRVLSLEVAA